MPIGRIADLTIETASEFRAATFSSAPDRPDDDFLAHHGRVWLAPVAKPEPSQPNKVVTDATMVLVGDSYVMQWGERNKTASEMLSAVKMTKANLLTRGAPYGPPEALKYIDVMSENALAVIGGVTSAAILANAGAMAWGSPFNTHIAQDNSQISLATAVDGITFAGSVGGWYGAVVLYARSLKDAIEASETPHEIDITTGWPE